MKRLKQNISRHRAGNVLTCIAAVLCTLTLGCQSNTDHKSENDLFDPQKDYFPIKVSIDHAIGFDLVYYNHWQELQLFRHYNDFVDTVRFALVKKGTPKPEGFDNIRVIETPVDRLASMSTTHLGMFEMLDALDHLKGVETGQYISNEDIKQLVEEGKIQELEPSGSLNTELAVNSGIEVLLGVGYPNSENDSYRELENVGIPVLLNADWQEKTLLGRAEWVKLLAVLLNKETLANERFSRIEDDFNEVLASVENKIAKGPLTITGIAQGDSWFVAGGRSFAYYLLELAKVEYPWKGSENTGSLRLDFETVYSYGLRADFWMVPSTAKTLDDILSADSRYADFKSFKDQNIYNIYGRYSPGGGNDFYESAVVNPHIVLKDIIRIFHPDLLPEHELVYYNRLK